MYLWMLFSPMIPCLHTLFENREKRVSNTHMSQDPKFTIEIVPQGDHLQVIIPELGIELETAPGEVRLEDAERIALAAIAQHKRRQYEAAQAKAGGTS
jgi:hypothetical protein